MNAKSAVPGEQTVQLDIEILGPVLNPGAVTQASWQLRPAVAAQEPALQQRFAYPELGAYRDRRLLLREGARRRQDHERTVSRARGRGR